MKKGQINIESLSMVVSVLLVVGILLGSGLLVMNNFKDKVEGTTIVRSVRNSEQPATLGTNLTMTVASAANDATCKGIVAGTFNVSNFTFGVGSVLDSSNYTFWNDTGVFNGTSANATGLLNFSFDYNYLNQTQAGRSTNESMAALGGFSNWFSIIITVIAAAVILGIVFRAFGRKGAL